jgi:hypothetical protein
MSLISGEGTKGVGNMKLRRIFGPNKNEII